LNRNMSRFRTGTTMPQPRQYGSDAQRQAAYRRRRKASEGVICPGEAQTGAVVYRQWLKDLKQILGELLAIETKMQAYYDGRPDAWQEGDRGERLAERIESVRTAIDAVEHAVMP
jgi:hypothetical protein